MFSAAGRRGVYSELLNGVCIRHLSVRTQYSSLKNDCSWLIKDFKKICGSVSAQVRTSYRETSMTKVVERNLFGCEGKAL